MRHPSTPTAQTLNRLYIEFTTGGFTNKEGARQLSLPESVVASATYIAAKQGVLRVVNAPSRPCIYEFTAQGRQQLTGTLDLKPAPKPPALVVNGSKDPAAILRQIRSQLEDQLTLIDEALETINADRTAADKYRQVAKILGV